MAKNETVFSKDTANKKLNIVREFDASPEQVWKAWTESELLDQWWGPKPYRAITKTMDFKEGGYRLYSMVGPAGDTTWCIERYKTIEPQHLLINTAEFCDEQGNQQGNFPVSDWKKAFNGTESATTVTIEITFDSEADMESLIQMGFKEGFTMGLNQLEDLLTEK
ncbi:MAG: SRPBCC domain-containing protein [Sphingobacteriaceae bacterium]|nr:MAG: SRPBCC domain-containing protein [Sphingobacteriaceae bacterium]